VLNFTSVDMCLVFLPPHASGDHTTIYAINQSCNHTPSETPPPGPYPLPSTTTRLRHSTQNTQRNRQNKITTQGSYLNIKNLLPYRSVKRQNLVAQDTMNRTISFLFLVGRVTQRGLCLLILFSSTLLSHNVANYS
jgi:hypothetical protein